MRKKDGKTYWFSDKKCPECQSKLVTDGKLYYCIIQGCNLFHTKMEPKTGEEKVEDEITAKCG